MACCSTPTPRRSTSRTRSKILREAVSGAGRDWNAFEVAQIVPCSVEETHEEAVEAVRWEAASRFESPNFAAETERRLRVGEPAIDRNDFPPIWPR